MKHLKLFFALFAMLALGVGNAWAEEELYKTALFGSSYNSKKVSSYTDTWTATNNGFTVTVVNANNNNNGWEYIKMGRKNNASVGSISTNDAIDKPISKVTLTIDALTAANINNITLKTSTSASGTYTSVGTFTKAKGSQSVEISNPTANLFYKIEVDCASGSSNGLITISKVEYYATTENTGGGDEPLATLTANPTTIDFGTVYQGADVESKTVAVDFENLTGNVTYSGLSTPFTATGTVSNDGDKITIAANTATIGEYSQTLTITSAADSKTAEVTVKMNVVEKPAPTGTFTLHTGDLIEGDYVIYYSGKAMKAVVSSNRLGYEEVTPSGNEIIDPLAETIWHIAPSGSNWTIYNDNKGYAAGNGTKNQAALVADPTGDNANKVAWTVTGTSTYEFVNVLNKSNSVNANLRNNGTYGFACYATSTGGALSLYRKAGAKYNVTVNSTTNGAVTADPTSAEAGTTITLTVTPETGYVLDALTVTDASSTPVTVTDNKFTMPASDVTVTATFKENEKPAATLTLSKNGVEETFPGSWKQDDVVTLPSIASDCVKEFVGWSANPTCNVAPEYAAGDSYTLTATAQTLYAVYAIVEGGEVSTSEDLFENNGTYNSTAGTITWELANVVSILQEKSNASSSVADYVKDPRWYKDHLITITPSANIKEIIVKAQSNDYATALASSTYTNATATASSDIVTITPTNGNEKITIKMGAQARLYTLTVTYASAVTYSNYSTTCAAALANPTFSLAEGKYTEVKSVTISAAEGTIYYTTDGTTPTASSTQYTGAIALNDCGEYTIKAIAISSDSESPVASATYTIQLPIEKGTEENPLSVADVLAIYNGGCYNGTDEVYVTGTVSSASYNTTYSNYTVTLTDNSFLFYRLVDENNLVTTNAMQAGDVLIAKGKLGEYQGKCQLIECVLVDYKAYEGVKIDISNNPDDPYTVEEAYTLIDDVNSDLANSNVYVKGIISKVDSYNSTYKSITYWISDDGTTTKQLQVYSGKNLNNTDFGSKNDLQVGDKVTVFGKLKKHETTYEFDYNNYLVSFERPEQEETVAALPFTFTGSLSDVENTDGMKQSGLGSYNTSLKLKFDDTGDYLTIHFDGEPGRLRYGIKGNPSNNVMTCIYKVQTSVDGTTYTDLETYTTLANTEKTMSHALNSDVRYVKFIFTEKKSGNVALGNITISQPAIVIGDGDNSSVIESAVAAGNPVDVIVNRGFTANDGYYTICVPFDMPASTIGTVYELGTITKHVSGEDGGININLTTVSTIKAGVPYLVLPNKTVSELLVENVTVVNTTGSSYEVSGAELKIIFTGIINGVGETTNGTTEYYVGNNGWLYNGTVDKLGLRSFFTITDLNGNPTRVRARVVAGENQATGVDNIVAPEGQAIKVIENGQLIIIRGGEKFNVQGQKL